MSDSTPSTHLTAELPPDLRWAAVAVHGLAKAGVLEALDRSVPLHRRPGATFADVILYLLLFFGSGQHLGGLRGFFEDFRDLSPLLGALGGRAKLISQSTLSTALAALNRAALVEPLQGFLLEGSGGLDLLRSPAVMTRDAGGRGWHFFDFDPSRTAFRQRMLPDSPELPLARRRLDAIAAPGYAGRKRGEIVATDGLLQHAGSRLWLNVTVDPGNGPRDSFEAALAAVVTCLLYTSPSPRDRTRSRMPSSA